MNNNKKDINCDKLKYIINLSIFWEYFFEIFQLCLKKKIPAVKLDSFLCIVLVN